MLIVVIDDSRTQAHRLRAFLEREGFAVRVATSGEAGLAACLVEPLPDAVVSDIVMPGIDGYEVCRRLKAQPRTRGIPVMLLTSLADPHDVVRALAAGADNFVTKPYRDEALATRLRRMITRAETPDDATIDIAGEPLRIEAPRSRVVELLVASLEDAAQRNAELEASRAALARAGQQREALMGIVAHELRSPLASLLLRAENSLHAPRPAEALTALAQAVERQVDRLIGIIDDLQDIARIEAGTMRIEPRPADIVEVVRDLIERIRPTTPSHVIVAHLPGPVSCHIDPSRIEQVVTNLVTNAAKYSAPRSRIEIRVEVRDTCVEVSVKDEGIGIVEESLPRVFDRFFRTADGEQKASGLGLGLFVCKQLVELHGGTIGVDSELGRGATFWFRIPRGEASADFA
ncbi:histidine kinase [Minicystis rosea]|nr:histidine kinase [Minicystis rosea]